MPRALQAFAAVLCSAALLSFVVPVPPLILWPAALIVALCLAATAVAGTSARDAWGARGEFLCDACKYNCERDCSRPERPNATRCPAFKTRLS